MFSKFIVMHGQERVSCSATEADAIVRASEFCKDEMVEVAVYKLVGCMRPARMEYIVLH